MRTNGESLLGVSSLNKKKDYSQGLAIGSLLQWNEKLKLEPCRYPHGSGLMQVFAGPLTNQSPKFPRIFSFFLTLFKKIPVWLYSTLQGQWPRRTILLLAMETKDTSMQLRWKRSLPFFRKSLSGGQSLGETPYLPEAQEFAQELSNKINGFPQNNLAEVVGKMTSTAHILGGAILGESKDKGVINHRHEIFDHPNLYISDGSVIPSNLGVNPSLTITALAERFCDQFPNNKQNG